MSVHLCVICGAEFQAAPSKKRRFCSHECSDAGHRRPLDIAEAKRRFDAGQPRMEIASALGFSKSHIYHRLRAVGICGRNVPVPKGEKNKRWKGDAVGYSAIHQRLRTLKGKAQSCVLCGKVDARWFDHANLTGRHYDLTDYVTMCRPCHRRYDSARRLNVHVTFLCDALKRIPQLATADVELLLMEARGLIDAALTRLSTKDAA